MIIGIGIDIVDLEEFRGRLSDEFAREVFLPSEMQYAASQARPWEHYAVRFAAKEATFKALGSGIAQGLSFRDIEVVSNASGAVALRFSGRALGIADGRKFKTVRVSLSHSRASAVAVVILEGDPSPFK